MGFRVLGFRAWGLGFRVLGLGLRILGLGFRVQSSGFRGLALEPVRGTWGSHPKLRLCSRISAGKIPVVKAKKQTLHPKPFNQRTADPSGLAF